MPRNLWNSTLAPSSPDTDVRIPIGLFLTLLLMAIPAGSSGQSLVFSGAQSPSAGDSLSSAASLDGQQRQPESQVSRTVADLEKTTLRSSGKLIWTLSTTSLFALGDHRLYTSTRAFINHSAVLAKASTLAVDAGNGGYQFGFAGALGLYGYLFDDQRARETAGECVEGILIDGFIVQTLKHISGRESPASATHSKGRWRFFPNPTVYGKSPGRYYSFPSGHISSTVATLTVLINNYQELRPYRPVAYATVGFLGMSLVAKGMHWYSDLPLGAFLGYTVGTAVSRPASEESGSSRLAFTVVPAVQDHSLALNASLTF